MPLSVSDILDSDAEIAPARLMSYGPINGEYHPAAMYGPQGNALGPHDVAGSPDSYQLGDVVDIGDGTYRRVADMSYFHPGQPTHHTIELRDKTDQGSGLVKKVTVNDILGPQEQGYVEGKSPVLKALEPPNSTPPSDVPPGMAAQPHSLLDQIGEFARSPSPVWLQPYEQPVQRGVRRALNLPVTRPPTGAEVQDVAQQDLHELMSPPAPEVGFQRPEQVTWGNLPQTALADIANFLMSPAGVVSPAIGMLPKTGQALVGAGFGAQMGQQSIQNFLEGKYPESAESALMAALGAHGAREAVTPEIARPSVPPEGFEVKTDRQDQIAKAISDMRAEADAANNPANYPYGSKQKPVEAVKNAPEAPPARPEVQSGSEPQPQSGAGTVRLYHGSASGSQIGSDFSPSQDYAQGYADKGTDGKVYYVDVPADAPFLERDEGADGRLIGRQVLPDEISSQAKPIDLAQEQPQPIPSQDEFKAENEPRPMDEPSGQQSPVPEQSAGMGGSRPPENSGTTGSKPSTGVSTKNDYTDAQRASRDFPEAVQEARRDFGSVWQESEETYRRDPGAGARLVEAINDGETRAVSDHDNALLLREQIRAQGEHTDAVAAVNDAKTPEDLTAAKARLVVARDSLQSVYDADKKAGRSTAQGLNARKMLATEEYSLAQMEARKRAANDGRPLNAFQLRQVSDLHARISELSDKVDQLQKARFGRGDFSRATREAQKEAKSAHASNKRFTDFMDEKAQKARERLIAKRGRLNAGIDPTNLVDEAIIGASHIAKGLTKFSDWSAQMIKDFGDRIKPFLKDLWNRSQAYHNASARPFRSPQERNLSTYKTRLAHQTIGVTAKIERGDFTKPTREGLVLDKATYQMKANLERLKNEFERGVAKDAYKHMGKADKFWQHFVGIERAMKLSSPAVFEKLGLAAAVREVLSPAESAVGYGVSKVFPKLAKGTRYGADLKTLTRAEIKAKASLFSQGMKDAWENVKGKETELEAMSDKYGRQPDFWYNRIGKIHAAVKAPVKRAEFVRSLEHRMSAAVKAGEDINHPEVMDRLATESALDANRAIFQQNTVVSKFFSMLDKASPAGGRAARFLFPVVKIPVNLFKELVTYNVGAPAAALKIGRAYWKGVETLEPAAREAIIRQLAKGSVGGAALLWGYYNSDDVHRFFKSIPPFFQHTPIAMAIHEGSLVKQLEQQGTGTHFRPTEAWKDARFAIKSDIPFAYTVTGLTDTLEPDGWRKYLYSMIQSSTVPQAASWTAKELDKPTPFSLTEKPRYRPPQNIKQSIEQGIPGFRQDVPQVEHK